MVRLALLIIFALANTAICAQLQPTPRAVRTVSDPGMVIHDRGADLEVLPARRATPQIASSGRQVVHSEFPASGSAPISPQQLGVVFNHAMQVHGYITGEIAFKMKDGVQAIDKLDPATYPGLAKLTNPNVYLVVASTPAEFIELVNRLQGRTDMEWVEPAVTYGVMQPAPDAR